MIICPNCHHQEYAGALFCSECAAQLVVMEKNYVVGATDIISDSEIDLLATRREKSQGIKPQGEEIHLKIMVDGSMVKLSGTREFTIGRGVKGQLILPDIDLGLYDAFSLGVSRLHAVMKLNQDMVIIMDLGSSNGTWINGHRIEPHVESELSHGDIVALGKLQFEVLFDVK
jgi:pSer/pThr/pTyr-binding forkhead associated (FHA) protein